MPTPYTVIYNNNNIITSVLQTEDTDFIKSQMKTGDQHKTFEDFQGFTEVHIDRFDEKGSWLTLEDQISKHLVPLEELYTDESEHYILMLDQADKGQNYLDTQKILKLIQDEIRHLGGVPFYSNELPREEETIANPIPFSVIYNSDKIITQVLKADNREFIDSQMKTGDKCKTFEEFEGYPGVHINRFDEKGSWLSSEEQISKHLIPLEELTIAESEHYNLMLDQANKGLNYSETQKILILIQEEITNLGGTPSYGSELPTEEEQIATTMNLKQEQERQQDIYQKQSEIFALREKFIDADIDDELELKETIKQEIKVKKQELAILEEQVTTDK